MAEDDEKLVDAAKARSSRLAPFVAVGCPGLITRDGTIEKGAQNLPGNWEDHDFSLPAELARQLPLIDGHEPLFVIHNDAVVQGLSEAATCRTSSRWGVSPSAPGSATPASPTGPDARLKSRKRMQRLTAAGIYSAQGQPRVPSVSR